MAKERRGRRRLLTSEAIHGYIFASPWLIGFLMFSTYPILAVIFYSFNNYDVVSREWVGLANYKEMFTNDPLFWKSIYNTFYYVVFAVPLGLIVSLGLAMLLNQRVRGVSLFRTFFYLPVIIPTVASAILWIWVLNPEVGLINDLLARFFHIRDPGWINDVQWSKPSLIIMSVWVEAGSTMIIFLAGLQDIPRQLYEAAEIDGANSWSKFRHITIPMLTPTIFFNLVMGIIWSFQVFTQVYIMTSGGPVYSTLFYVLHLYNNAFQYFRMGYASAMAIALFVIILIFTLIIVRTSPKWVHYGGE